MKQSYIIHEHHPRLLLFFAGWGADETPFKMYRPAASDFMVCYDYRTLDFDASGLEKYREINLIGWSMGVWAASQTMPQLSSPGTSGEGIHMANSIAINGTPYPIDQHMGIPPAIYHGTLDGLTGASLHKFLRRMCANGAAFKAFLEITPRRPLEELRDELTEIEKMYHTLPAATFHWQQAVTGGNDRIIPPANQLQAWGNTRHPRAANGGCPLSGRVIQTLPARPMDKPLNPMDKQLIASRFAKARNTYTREARVQQQVAEKMMQLIKEPYTRFHRVVEFGCGTGSYSRILLHTLQPETLLLNDLCREMEECVKELCDGTTVQFVPGDAEAIDFPGETDLITSCSTLQWFNDPGAFFTRCHQALVADGLLAFSTFGATNMHEIRQLTGHGLDYPSIKELQALLSPGFDILHAEEEVISLPFPTPQAVLKHLKQTGVTGTEKKDVDAWPPAILLRRIHNPVQ